MTPAQPFYRPCELYDPNAAATVPATLIVDFPTDRLSEVESDWQSARLQGIEWARTQGIELDHGRWDWRNKIFRATGGIIRLIGLECKAAVQGLAAVCSDFRASRIEDGAEVVYLDYLESAAWNVQEMTPSPRHLGVGTQLLGEAIRISLVQTTGGRIGLHALPNAELFYQRCGMTRIGPDPHYYRLCSYEFTTAQAVAFMHSRGLPL